MTQHRQEAEYLSALERSSYIMDAYVGAMVAGGLVAHLDRVGSVTVAHKWLAVLVLLAVAVTFFVIARLPVSAEPSSGRTGLAAGVAAASIVAAIAGGFKNEIWLQVMLLLGLVAAAYTVWRVVTAFRGRAERLKHATPAVAITAITASALGVVVAY